MPRGLLSSPLRPPGGVRGHGGPSIRGVAVLHLHDLGAAVALGPGLGSAAGVLLASEDHHHGGLGRARILVGEELGRAGELRAALGTDLGVVLLASITWEEEGEEEKASVGGWRGRNGHSEALISHEPSYCWLGEGR